MTAPSPLLAALEKLTGPKRCATGRMFDEYLTDEEQVAVAEAVTAAGVPMVFVRDAVAEATGQVFKKDNFNNHVQRRCGCE